MDKQVELHGASMPGAVKPAVRRRRPRVALILLLVVIAIAAGVAWRLTHSGGPARSGPPGGVTSSVSVTAAANGSIDNWLQELGTVTSLAGVTVTTQISGVLQSVGFTEGQSVKKGDFLAQIDDRPYRALLEQYQGTLAHDQGLLAQARTNLARYQRLAKQDSIAQQTVDDERAVVQQDEGTIAADQAQINNEQLNISYCRIIAPVDGVVGLRQVDPGNYISAGSSTGIVVLNQITPISVLFSIPEDNIPALHAAIAKGQPIAITLYDRAGADQLATGTLATLDNTIDTSTGTFKLRAIFPNRDSQLVPNQFVNVDMLVSKLAGVLTVPVAAIQTGAPGTYVYTVGPDNVAHVVKVTTGAQDADHVQILSGLAAGDRVVTDGVDRLRDGIHVTIAGTAPAAAGGAARHRPLSPSGGAAGGAAGGAPAAGGATP